MMSFLEVLMEIKKVQLWCRFNLNFKRDIQLITVFKILSLRKKVCYGSRCLEFLIYVVFKSISLDKIIKKII